MRGRIKQWIGFAVMVVGTILLIGPFLQGDTETKVQQGIVAGFRAEMNRATDAPTTAPTVSPTAVPTVTAAVTDAPPTETTEATPTEATAAPAETPTAEPVPEVTQEPQDDFFRDALAYNQSLVEKGQHGMRSLNDLERFKLDATKYGYSENMIGIISIPRIDVEVALYLGATSDHMANGFAVFGMTSLPLGLGEENVAIAGHRGWRGTAMLRDVQMIRIGDPIYITTPWRELTYIVSGIEIVMPNNNEWCKLKPGKTMISLMTCHPYGQHTQRYIVYAELSNDQTGETAPEISTVPATDAPSATPRKTATVISSITAKTTADVLPETTPDPTECPTENLTTIPSESPAVMPTEAPVQEITFVHDDGTRETIVIDATAVDPDEREYSTVWSNTLIEAENNMRPVAYVTAGIVALVGVWLVIATIRDAKKNKRGEHHDEK